LHDPKAEPFKRVEEFIGTGRRRFWKGGIVLRRRLSAYQNFADPSLKDWRAAYYGDNLGRLQRIKAAVDPDRVFDFPQAL
jgi:hypothetical protein